MRALRRLALCRSGRRCTTLEPVELNAPAGTRVRIFWTCRRCGTLYSRDVLVGFAGSFTDVGVERIRAR